MLGGLGSGGIGEGLGAGRGGTGSGPGTGGPGGTGCGGELRLIRVISNACFPRIGRDEAHEGALNEEAVTAGGSDHRLREDNSTGSNSQCRGLLNINREKFFSRHASAPAGLPLEIA
jgi:hypothetical protein